MISIVSSWNSDLFKEPEKYFLKTANFYKIIAETNNRDQALLATIKLKPDLLILDHSLPGTASMNLILEIIKIQTQSKVLLVLADDFSVQTNDLILNQFDGVVFRGDHPSCVLEVIQGLFKNRIWQEQTGENLLTRIEINPKSGPPFALIESELKVLRLIAKGYKNQSIAKELSITEKTVEYHIGKIFKRLNVQNRTEAAFKGHEFGIF